MAKRTTRDINSAISGSFSDSKESTNFREQEVRAREKKLNEIREYYYKQYRKRYINNEKQLYEDALKKFEAVEKRKQDLLKENTKRTKREAEELHKAKLEQLEEEWQLATSYEEKLAIERKQNAEEYAEKVRESLSNMAGKVTSALLDGADTAVDSGLSVYSKYMASIDARIQGSGASFLSMLKTIQNNLTGSPYVKQIDVIENLSELVSQGIAYNVEQRAFLQTVSDKIATTFDATNGVLLRLIRIQQADTTAARLGLEANLTRYLNETYEDTSYLSDQFDNVSAALYDATSLAGRNLGVELEYVVQKWLGSLYSVGASDTLINNLATGIGYLGSGNISELSSNEGLQNLLVMASSRAGLSYSEMLSGGLSAEDANKLLNSAVSYIQEIASSDSLVVKSQYAELFGMTISDMTALLNLSSEDLVSISENMLSYSDTISEVNYQLSQVASRTPVSELVDNVIENATLTLGLNIAGNAASYALYKVGDVIDQLTGDLQIPTVSVLGSSVDLNMTYGQLLQSGVIGINAIPTLISAVASLGNGGGLNLNSWGGQEYMTRGTGITSTTYGATTGVSSSAIIGSTSSTDVTSQSITAAKEETTAITGEEEEEDDTLDNIEQNTFDMVKSLISIENILTNVSSGISSFRVSSLYNSTDSTL